MSEINGPKFNLNQVNFNGVQKQALDIPAENIEADEQKVKDLGDPREVIGRSMLEIKDADNVNHDLKALIDNPQIADNSDALFETAYNVAKDANIKNPYEEAASFSTGSV